MLVEATEMSVRLRVKVKELGRFAEPGERFEISPSRFKVLNGENRFNAVFVQPVESEEIYERDDVEPFVSEEQPKVYENEESVKTDDNAVAVEVKPKKKRGRKKSNKNG